MINQMKAIYDALRVFDFAVSRAWPQHPIAVPGVTYRLAGWGRTDAGRETASFQVLIRGTSPEDTDRIFSTVKNALQPLGLYLTSASDETDEESGAFLKYMFFSAQIGEVSVLPLVLSVRPVGTWIEFAGMPDIEVTPAKSKAVDASSLAVSGLLIPATPVIPSLIKISSPYNPTCGAQTAISSFFASGAALPYKLTKGGLSTSGSSRVTALTSTPAGFYAELIIL